MFVYSQPQRKEKYSGTTNASGLYTITFAAPFAAVPMVTPVVVGSNTETSWRIVSRSETGFSIHVYARAKLTVTLIDLLSFAVTNVSGAIVDVTVEGN